MSSDKGLVMPIRYKKSAKICRAEAWTFVYREKSSSLTKPSNLNDQPFVKLWSEDVDLWYKTDNKQTIMFQSDTNKRF